MEYTSKKSCSIWTVCPCFFKFIFYDGYIVKKTTCLTLNHLKHNIQYITNLIDKKRTLNVG